MAKRRAVDANGVLLSRTVRVREAIRLQATMSAVVRWRSAKALQPGIYLLQVTAVETGGVTDCPPKQLRGRDEQLVECPPRRRRIVAPE